MMMQSIFSYEPAPPEDMGFFAPGYKQLENREQRKKAVEQAIEEITPTPPEKEVAGQKEEEKKDEDLCELQLSPMDVDKVFVNGVELTKGSLTILRAARSFPGISDSGSKLRVINHNKEMELLNARRLVSEAKAQETKRHWVKVWQRRQIKPLRQSTG